MMKKWIFNQSVDYQVTRVASLVVVLSFLHLSAVADDFSELSLEELMDVSISSASKRDQKLSDVAAAISVVTKEDLRRRGIDNLPDALRMVPGVHVATSTANFQGISIRGFTDDFANKLLVLVDGQSVFSDLFSGTFWSINSVPIDDVEQIEVIRGPGSSVWGLNAVNGVINIITKNAADQNNAVRVIAGNDGHQTTARVKTKLGDYTHARFTLASDVEDGKEGTAVSQLASTIPYTEEQARNTDNNSERRHVTIRVDREKGNSSQMFYYGNQRSDSRFDSLFSFGAPQFNDQSFERAIFQTNFATGSNSELTLQGNYKDLTLQYAGFLAASNSTYEAELRHQHNWDRHQLIYGLTYKDWTSITQGLAFVFSPLDPVLEFSPKDRHIVTKSGFFQSQHSVGDGWQAIIGARYDDNSVTDGGLQPSLRMLKRFDSASTAWAAVSKSIRTPSRFQLDVDLDNRTLVPTGNPQAPEALLITQTLGNKDLEVETAYVAEVGYRRLWSENFSSDINIFYHEFDDLTTQENLSPEQGLTGGIPTTTLVGRISSAGEARLKGVEWSLDWQYRAYRFGVNGAYSSIDYMVDNASQERGLNGSFPVAPRYLLGSYLRWDISDEWEFDLWTQFVDDIDSDDVSIVTESFLRVDMRLAYMGIPDLTIAFQAEDIGDSGDVEFESTTGVFTPYESVRMEPVYKLDVEYQF